MRALVIQVRAERHIGERENMGDGISGMAVHIGARVFAMANAGEVLVSTDPEAGSGRSGPAFEARWRQQLKGVPDDWEIYAVI